MTDDFVLMLKEILDKAGVEITMEQLEAGLNAMVDDMPKEDPWLDEVIRKIEEEHKGKKEPDDEGYSFKGMGQYSVLSGEVELEFSGQASKKYQGGAALLMKPDDSLIVHGLRGVKPVSYMARAEDILFKSKDRKLIVEAISGNDRLTVTFTKMILYEDLVKNLPPKEKSATIEREELTADEKALETKLKKLRIDLAHSNGTTFLPAIFDNRALYELVKQRPGTIEELRRVKWLGEKRIAKYGDPILKTINETTAESA